MDETNQRGRRAPTGAAREPQEATPLGARNRALEKEHSSTQAHDNATRQVTPRPDLDAQVGAQLRSDVVRILWAETQLRESLRRCARCTGARGSIDERAISATAYLRLDALVASGSFIGGLEDMRAYLRRSARLGGLESRSGLRAYTGPRPRARRGTTRSGGSGPTTPAVAEVQRLVYFSDETLGEWSREHVTPEILFEQAERRAQIFDAIASANERDRELLLRSVNLSDESVPASDADRQALHRARKWLRQHLRGSGRGEA